MHPSERGQRQGTEGRHGKEVIRSKGEVAGNARISG